MRRLSKGIYRRWGKRAFDLAAASLGLVLLSPLLLLAAVVVRVTSRGPVFFRQVRQGLGGRPFKLIKFRTMRHGADRLGASVVVPKDSRLTPVGGLLRRSKIDEIPQLINVLLGEMSLVGPRPRVPENVYLELPEERALFTQRPGITSYATIYHHSEEAYCCQQRDPNAAYRELQMQKSRLDAQYLKNLSFAVDLKLILLTLLLVFPGKSKPKPSRLLGREIHPYSRAAQMLLETLVFAIAVWLAYWLRFDGQMPGFRRTERDLLLLILPLARLSAHKVFGIYDMVWRYVNRLDAEMLAITSAFVSGGLLILRLLLPVEAGRPHLLSPPLGVIALEYLLVASGTVGLRALRRTLYELSHRYQPWRPERQRRILLLGAGLSGVETALAIARCPHLEVLGFVDDDPEKYGRLIAGSRVLGSSEKLDDLILKREATDVVICTQSLSPHRLRKIQECCRATGARAHAIPTVDQILATDNVEAEMTAASTEVA